MDLLQEVLKEGRLKFAEKGKAPMKIDYDPLQTQANYVEPTEINMAVVTKDHDMEVEAEVG